jgi:hypothetical protein
MGKFMFLFRGGGIVVQPPPPPAEIGAHLAKRTDWVGGLVEAGHLEVGPPPLQNDGKVVRGSAKTVTDGPYAEAKDLVSGIVVISASSLEAAVELARGCPIYEYDGSVEVRPLRRTRLRLCAARIHQSMRAVRALARRRPEELHRRSRVLAQGHDAAPDRGRRSAGSFVRGAIAVGERARALDPWSAFTRGTFERMTPVRNGLRAVAAGSWVVLLAACFDSSSTPAQPDASSPGSDIDAEATDSATGAPDAGGGNRDDATISDASTPDADGAVAVSDAASPEASSDAMAADAGQTCLGNVSIDFAALAPYWTAPVSACGTATFSNHALTLTEQGPGACSASLGGAVDLDFAHWALCGDFDLQVAFDVSADTEPVNGTAYIAGFRALDTINATSGISLERFIGTGDPCHPATDFYKAYARDNSCAAAFIPTTTVVGKMRLVRVGTTVTSYVSSENDAGGWTQTFSATGVTQTPWTIDFTEGALLGADSETESATFRGLEIQSAVTP